MHVCLRMHVAVCMREYVGVHVNVRVFLFICQREYDMGACQNVCVPSCLGAHLSAEKYIPKKWVRTFLTQAHTLTFSISADSFRKFSSSWSLERLRRGPPPPTASVLSTSVSTLSACAMIAAAELTFSETLRLPSLAAVATLVEFHARWGLLIRHVSTYCGRYRFEFRTNRRCTMPHDFVRTVKARMCGEVTG